MDKSWMNIVHRTKDKRYETGVGKFLEFAYCTKEESCRIPCPCKSCNNFRSYDKETVRSHLLQGGISKHYVRWIYHGENYEGISNDYLDGTKSLARHVHERKPQGKRVLEVDAYEIVHFSVKKGKMVNDKAQENLNSMREIESSSSQSTSKIWSFQMPNKPPPGHVKGRAVPQRQFQIARIMQEQLDKEKQRAEEAEQRAACMVEQLNAQKEELTSLREEQSRTNAKMDLLLEEFSRITRGH